jgi:glutaminase
MEMNLAMVIRRGLLLVVMCASCGMVYPGAVAQNTTVSPVAPKRQEVERVVQEAYDKFKGDTGGKNADYIPYLAHVD